MSDENWGIGDAVNKKPFGEARLGDEDVELIFGQYPHSRQDNNIYAKTKGGSIYGFSGHRLCFKILIEENNYLKTSSLSGDEIRKSCTGKLSVNGVQVFEAWHRGYERCYQKIQEFILNMEEHWGWYPLQTEKEIGRVIGYREQLFKIKSFIIPQGCMILETLDGNPRKKFLWEDNDDYEGESTVKVEITADGITWFPKQ